MSLSFCTTNTQKFAKGQEICAEFGIELVHNKIEIDEIQSEDPLYVVNKKAEAAFQEVRTPVIVSDDAWIIPGLNGFPGVYAKSMNAWFSAEDYIRLTKNLRDRRVFLIQSLVYTDSELQKDFSHKAEGLLLRMPRGDAGFSIQKVVSLEHDGQASISEVIGAGTHHTGFATTAVWHEFAKWYTEEKK